MKKQILFLSAVTVIASTAFIAAAQADELPGGCYAKAAQAAEKFTAGEGRSYDQDGFNAYECVIAPNGKAVVCDVSASKGDGAAYDTYRVVLSESCQRTYRVELTGEE